MHFCSDCSRDTHAACDTPSPPLAAVYCGGSEPCSPRLLFLRALLSPAPDRERQPGSQLRGGQQASRTSPLLAQNSVLRARKQIATHFLRAQPTVSSARGLTRLRSHLRAGLGSGGTVHAHPAAGRILFVIRGLKSLLSCWPSTRGHSPLLEATPQPHAPFAP